MQKEFSNISNLETIYDLKIISKKLTNMKEASV